MLFTRSFSNLETFKKDELEFSRFLFYSHRIPFRPDGTDLGFVRLEPFLLELELVLSCCQHQLLNFPDIGNMDLFCSFRFF